MNWKIIMPILINFKYLKTRQNQSGLISKYEFEKTAICQAGLHQWRSQSRWAALAFWAGHPSRSGHSIWVKAQTAIIEASALWATAAFPTRRIFNNLAKISAKKLKKKRLEILILCLHSRTAIARQEPRNPKDLLGIEPGWIWEISIFSKKVIGRGLWY